jgi:nitrile hydratase
VVRNLGGFVFPDTNAHGLGEQPQHLYTVRFDASELWGREADGPGAVHVDLFDTYLERA